MKLYAILVGESSPGQFQAEIHRNGADVWESFVCPTPQAAFNAAMGAMNDHFKEWRQVPFVPSPVSEWPYPIGDTPLPRGSK